MKIFLNIDISFMRLVFEVLSFSQPIPNPTHSLTTNHSQLTTNYYKSTPAYMVLLFLPGVAEESHTLADSHSQLITKLISIILRFIRTFFFDADISCLLIGQGFEFDPDFGEVESGHFFIQLFGQSIYLVFVLIPILPQLHLSQGLIGK